MSIKRPYSGWLAFTTVLLCMPIGHAFMVAMQRLLPASYLYPSASLLGGLGVLILTIKRFDRHPEVYASLRGLLGGLFIWTGWIEFAFVYIAKRHEVQPLVEAGRVVTKPEYLIMPASIGFLGVFLIHYVLDVPTACHMLRWIQRKLGLNVGSLRRERNLAVITATETIVILWAFYLLLLIAYDKQILGDHHIGTAIIAYGCLGISALLVRHLVKISGYGLAIRVAIPTVIIFWTAIEIFVRWRLFKEIWVHPFEYAGHILTLLCILGICVFLSIRSNQPLAKSISHE